MGEHKLPVNHLGMTAIWLEVACDYAPQGRAPVVTGSREMYVSHTDYILSFYLHKVAHQSCTSRHLKLPLL